MERSLALFSPDSPFPAPRRPRGHYRPSPPRPPGAGVHGAELGPPEPPDPPGGTPASSSSSPFPESWPSTESSSPRGADSVIATYMERFRRGEPSSRSQRQAPALVPPAAFWWLQPPRGPSPEAGAAPAGCTEPRGASQALDAPPLDSPEGSDNPETRSLQERAAQLLLRSASSLGSSEGLSPHPTSSPRTSKPDTAAGFLCSGFLIDGPGNEVASEFGASRASPFTLGCLSASHIPQSSSLRPEDDILFQWRLRRKMEVASEGTSGVWRTPGVPLWRGDTAWLGLRAASSSRDSGPQAPQQGVGPAGGGGAFPPADHAPIQLAPAPAPTPSWMPGEDGDSSHDAPGPSRRTPVMLSRDALGPDRTVQRPSSHDALGPDGMVQRPSSHDALGSNGMAQRPNSHDASGPSRWTPVTPSLDALGLDGTAHRPSSHDAPGPSRWTLVTPSHDALGPDGTTQRPSSHDAVGPDGMVQRPSSHDALGSNGTAQRPNSQDASGPSRWTPLTPSHDALGPDGMAQSPNSHDALGPSKSLPSGLSHNALGHGRPSFQAASWPGGPAQETASHDAWRRDPRPRSRARLRQGGRGGPECPPQAVRRALGQVIAERLLSPPLGQEESVGPLGQEEQPVAPLGQESFPPGQEPAPHTQLLGLAARLLQEAEDSDGTEFEADPLLQVLRGQREVLRRCLRAVDLKVMQLEGGGSPEHDGSPC